MKSNLAHKQGVDNDISLHPSTAKKLERQAMSKKDDGYSPLPNFICDEGYLAVLSGDAVKCIVLLNRHIKGFHLDQKSIGETLVMKITGIKDKRTVRKCMADLAKYQLISITKTLGKSSSYTLTLDDRISIEAVASNVTTSNTVTSNVVTSHVTTPVTSNATTPVASNVTTTSDIKCHSVKEIDLKENIKENFKERNAQENSDAQVWNPNLETLSSILKTTKHSHRVSEILSLEDFQFHLGNFNTHHEKNFQLTDNQKHRKFAQWIIQEFERVLEKAERKNKQSSGYTRSEKPNSNLDVNTAWADQASQYHAPVDSPVHIPEDFV